MELLKQKILDHGRALNEHVLLVDSFLNHQVDVNLMHEVGKEFARRFADAGITRVITIEASGITPAAMAAMEMNLPLVIMKKSVSSILKEGTLQTEVFSFTKNSSYMLTLKSQFITPGDKVLLIDDFLANGEAAFGAIRLIEQAGASVAGIGIVITKAFQPGLKKLREAGYCVESLASVKRMGENLIEFGEDA
ncbi:MAG: xanthine phosphoribosyltransferase [Clostridia bacterium]|nr:xanthine phosphoribosyltransferase [Clostridia bacterium]